MKFGFKDNRLPQTIFIEEMKGTIIECDAIFQKYKKWCEEHNLKVSSYQAFYGELRSRKIRRCVLDGKMVYKIG